MKRNLLLISIAILLCVLLCACEWMDGSYVSVTPHREQNPAPEQEVRELATYSQLQQALVDLAADGAQNRTFAIPLLDQSKIDEYMASAITYLLENDAIGAYSVDEVGYELGTNAGKPAIAVEISYIHDRAEMVRVQRVETMKDAKTVIATALEECVPNVVFLVSQYQDVDLIQMIQDYSNDHPEIVMEVPQTIAAVYPDKGVERIIEISFTYQSSREALRSMQETVQPIFTSAELYVSGDAEAVQKFSQLYSFLIERHEYKIKPSITPAYSLLRHGIGDCRAFSNVYAAMCRQAGLDCRVVSGTREGEAWYWNIIVIDGAFYHIDLLADKGFRLCTDAEMTGYVWDFSAYPASE